MSQIARVFYPQAVNYQLNCFMPPRTLDTSSEQP